MLAAYNDSLGLTSAFNLNLLARINRELGGDFDLRQFAHAPRFNQATSSIEMHLRSNARQLVHFTGEGYSIEFEDGETIWTESCHKYDEGMIAELALASRFRAAAQWIDREWPFAENLFVAE